MPVSHISRNCIVSIIDYGSDFALPLAVSLQENSVLCFCVDGDSATGDVLDRIGPGVIILCGGRENWRAPNTHRFRSEVLQYAESRNIYVLGLAFGMQLLVQSLGGEVVRVEDEYRYVLTNITVKDTSDEGFFGKNSEGDKLLVSTGYGYEIVKLPQGFEVAAEHADGSVAAVSNIDKKFYGLNFPVQIRRREDVRGTIEYFLFNVCGVCTVRSDLWFEMTSSIIDRMVGHEGRVICGIAQNMDSIIIALLFYRVLGDRLHCVLVDNGLLRYKEKEELMVTFQKNLEIPFTCVEVGQQLLTELRRREEGETKEDVIEKEYRNSLDDFGREMEQECGTKPVFLVHGILKFDYSCPTHTHVGVLPEELEFKFVKASSKDEFICELGEIDTDIFIRLFPAELFKRASFEDQAIAVYSNGFAVLTIPQTFLRGHPLLGISGLVSNVVCEGNDLDILRKVDEILFQMIKDARIHNPIWKIATYLALEDQHLQLTLILEPSVGRNWKLFEHRAFALITRQICDDFAGVSKVSCRSTIKHCILGC